MSEATDKVDLARAIGQVVMTWLAFVATFLITFFFLGFFVWCVFHDKDTSTKWVTGIIDGFLLQLLTIIYKSIFPTPTQSAIAPSSSP